MKKRMLAIAFAVMMACGIAGCAEGTEDTVQQENETSAAAELQTEAQTEMQAELQSYPADLNAEGAAEAGMYTIEKGAVVSGQDKWDAFMAKETDAVILCQFSVNGGAMLDYLYRQEDGSYLIVSDLSRDGYEYEEKKDYDTNTFTEMKVFENFAVTEGGTTHTICVMTDDAELTAETFLQYWNELSYEENGAFLLFVI